MTLPLTNHKIWRRELEYAAHPKNPGEKRNVNKEEANTIMEIHK